MPARRSHPLDEPHRVRQWINGRATSIRLEVALRDLPDLSDASRDRYVELAVPAIVAGQNVAAELAAGYVRGLAGATAFERPLTLELGDVAVTPATGWLESPIIRARAKLAEEPDDYAGAIASAASYASALAIGDLQNAMRLGLERGVETTGKRAKWTKVPAGSACEWCNSVANELYDSPGSVPFHERDACGVAPVFE